MSAQSEVFSSHGGACDLSIGDRNEFGFIHNEQIDKIKSGKFYRLILYGKHGPYTEDDSHHPMDVCIDVYKVTDREWKEGLYVRQSDLIAFLRMRDVRVVTTNLPNFGVFGPLLQKLKKLIVLDIMGCQIGTDGLELIAETFHSSVRNNLRALYLQGCNIHDFRPLVRYPLQTLDRLDLSQNSLESKENCCALGSMLELHGKELKSLYLKECSICDKGAEILSHAFEKNKSLADIFLGGNSFGSQGRAAFSRLLCDDSRNSSLRIHGIHERHSVLRTSSKESAENNRVKEVSDNHRKYIANLEKENASLKSELKQLKNKETIDLTTDDNHNGETDSKPPPSKRLRSSGTKPSGLAYLHEQSQAVVKIKVEATERATEAERKAEAAMQEKEMAELKLECPTCSEVDKDSCALVPCGHTFCSDCCNNYASTNCPTCRREVASFLRLFR